MSDLLKNGQFPIINLEENIEKSTCFHNFNDDSVIDRKIHTMKAFGRKYKRRLLAAYSG